MKNERECLSESVLMSQEIDTVGEFIFAAIEKFNSMEVIDEPAEAFFVLYHLAVGIERLQKVLIVLAEDIERDEIKTFLEKIKTHNHESLHVMISKHKKFNLSPEQNGLLVVLSDFYQGHRYDRFDFFDYENFKANALSLYFEKYFKGYGDLRGLSERHLNDTKLKEFLGRTVGKLCQMYFEEIRNICNIREIYSYELRHGSKAAKLFRTTDDKKSYQSQINKEGNSIKELILYLMNTEDKNEFLDFLRGIQPLGLEKAHINYYLEELTKKNVAEELIDDVEYNLFETEEYSREDINNRRTMLDMVGNSSVLFDMDEDDFEGEEDDQ